MLSKTRRVAKVMATMITDLSAAFARSFEMSLEGQVAKHVKKITEHMTVPTCPGCGISFLDFSGCFAITCCVCRTGFCGFCLHNCGKQDPHIHSGNCPFYGQHFLNKSQDFCA